MRKTDANELAGIVVTHNRLEKLKLSVAALLAAPEAVLSALIVVDNASAGETADWLAAQSDPRLTVIRSEHNLGGAGGFALGLRRAMEMEQIGWVVVMDDDARPEPDALARFMRVDQGDADAVFGAVFLPDGPVCDMNRPWRNPFWNLKLLGKTLFGGGREAFHLGAEDYAPTAPRQPVDGGSFVGLFLSRRAIALAGYPDPGLFIYGDDVLYTLEFTRRGGRAAFDPGLRFTHDFTSANGSGKRFQPFWKGYYHYRNLLMVYRKSAGLLFWPVLLVLVPKWLLRARHYGVDRRRYLRLLARALRDGLAQRTDVPHAEVVARFGI